MAFATHCTLPLRLDFLLVCLTIILLLNKIQDDDEVGSERLGKSIVWIMFWAWLFLGCSDGEKARKVIIDG
jgi:hypothetical protein